MRTLELPITKELSGRTVDSVLRNELSVSGTLVKRLKHERRIFADDVSVPVTYRLLEGEILRADIENDIVYGKPPSFSILHETEDCLALEKPAGMLTHATKVTCSETTVASELKEYMGEGHFHPVNRLDRGTSGVMLVAKNGYTHNLYKDKLHTDEFCRTYLAVLCGHPREREGIIDLPIGRDSVSPVLRRICCDGKPAQTFYKVIAENDKYTLAEIVPKTGRTHQIRLHMSAIGCPIACDFLYGTECDDINRCALHSHKLRFFDFAEKQTVEVVSPLPKDMQSLIGDGERNIYKIYFSSVY